MHFFFEVLSGLVILGGPAAITGIFCFQWGQSSKWKELEPWIERMVGETSYCAHNHTIPTMPRQEIQPDHEPVTLCRVLSVTVEDA